MFLFLHERASTVFCSVEELTNQMNKTHFSNPHLKSINQDETQFDIRRFIPNESIFHF